MMINSVVIVEFLSENERQKNGQKRQERCMMSVRPSCASHATIRPTKRKYDKVFRERRKSY